MAKKTLTKKSEDISKWYTQVILQSEMGDYSPVKGSMVMRPGSYELWENIRDAFDPMMKKMGVRNAYFPIFIPMSFLEKEAKHVEGFAPELAIVTHGGGQELEEKLAVRPTSETIMYSMYSKWISSHRDLPLALNQWNNVVRWEKRTYFFLRTLEFLWQEAHIAHKDHQSAKTAVIDFLNAYRELAEEYLAIPVVRGNKSQSETFAGAELTTTIEAMMPDGKALQSGTSHDLGQNFSKKSAFDVSFQDENGNTEYVHLTSHGLSTRILGALILVHGDDDGVVIPPRVAPFQVAIVTSNQDETVDNYANHIKQQLTEAGVRTIIDDKPNSLGWKLNDAELKGYPLIMVAGKREMAADEITFKVRHSHQEVKIKVTELSNQVPKLLTTIQADMLDKARANMNKLTAEAKDYQQFKQIMVDKKGFIKAFWCEDESCETAIKEETKATTRCLPHIDDQGTVEEEQGECVYCQKPATHRWLFAQAY